MVATSPDGARFSYSVDVLSREMYTVHAIDLTTNSNLLSNPIEDCTGEFVWASDNETLFWVKQDEKLRGYQVRPPWGLAAH